MTTTITYAVLNEGHQKLTEFPPRIGALAPVADSLQTVLATVPLPSNVPIQHEVEDTNYSYFYCTQGGGSRFLAGCACRRMPGHTISPETKTEVRQFLQDALKLIPHDAGKIVIDDQKIREVQKLLQARLEASTDKKLADVNAAIDKARRTMEENIEKTLARDEHLKRMQDNSNVMAETAVDLKKSTEDLNWQMLKKRIKTALMVIGLIGLVSLILSMMICKPNFSDCKSAANNNTTATTTSAPNSNSAGGGVTTAPPPKIIIGSD